MPFEPEPLTMYGRASGHDALDWEWVAGRLEGSGTYWTTAPTTGHPHPRPVWGVWQDDALYLSIGSPALAAALQPRTPVTVHLDSGTEVVIVEGVVVGPSTPTEVLSIYNAKYDWKYEADEYGELTEVQAELVLAWRSAGWAGRGGFQQTGRWRFTR